MEQTIKEPPQIRTLYEFYQRVSSKGLEIENYKLQHREYRKAEVNNIILSYTRQKGIETLRIETFKDERVAIFRKKDACSTIEVIEDFEDPLIEKELESLCRD